MCKKIVLILGLYSISINQMVSSAADANTTDIDGEHLVNKTIEPATEVRLLGIQFIYQDLKFSIHFNANDLKFTSFFLSSNSVQKHTNGKKNIFYGFEYRLSTVDRRKPSND